MSDTSSWLDSNHPVSYVTHGDTFRRCPTCEEWSPCRVRSAFEALWVAKQAYPVLPVPDWWDGL